MAKDPVKAVNEALAQVGNGRRGFLKGLLVGSAALAALPLLKSEALAQDQGGDGGTNPPKKKKKKTSTDGAEHLY